MHLSGQHVLNATPDKAWKILMDADSLSKVIPGITKLEKTGENSFKSILEIKVGPVSGLFTGQIHLEEIMAPKGFTLKVLQHSKIGNADSSIKIDLLPVEGNQTEIAFDGKVRLTGLLASMGHRVMGGISHTITNQFFSNLDRELKKDS